MAGGTPGGTEMTCPTCGGSGQVLAGILTAENLPIEASLSGVPLQVKEQHNLTRTPMALCSECGGTGKVPAE